MGRAWVLLAVLIVASCGGGVALSAQDQDLADEFWSNLNEFEHEELCEEMDTAAGRADGARMVEDALTEMEISESVESLDDDSSGEDALDAIVGPATVEANEDRADRAVEIVKYLREKC